MIPVHFYAIVEVHNAVFANCFAFSVLPAVWHHGWAFSVHIEEWKTYWPCLTVVLLQCWMIGVWGEKKSSDMNICLLHLFVLTSLPYWSFQDISWLVRRVQCQSAFDHFTLSSSRVLNSSQPRKQFEVFKVSCRLLAKMLKHLQEYWECIIFFLLVWLRTNVFVFYSVWNPFKSCVTVFSMQHVWFGSEWRVIYF